MDSLALTFKETHGRYATHWNVPHASSGHVWQGRYYSCPLDSPHLWAALRYTELNPVRAGLVREPQTYAWSSAAVHCGKAQPDGWMEMDLWQAHWNASAWREYLVAEDAPADVDAIRQCTHTGRPLGSPEFVEELEKATGRCLIAQKGGRPAKGVADTAQQALVFDR